MTNFHWFPHLKQCKSIISGTIALSDTKPNRGPHITIQAENCGMEDEIPEQFIVRFVCSACDIAAVAGKTKDVQL